MTAAVSPRVGANGLRADSLSAAERLDEVSRILAVGLVRLHLRDRPRSDAASPAEAGIDATSPMSRDGHD